jgi:shikimate dehydrogenase
MSAFGLIGHPLSHSFSKAYFENKFNVLGLNGYSYSLFDIENEQQLSAFKTSHPFLSGLNVTIPYKQTVMRYLDGISESARAIGAVNTIKIIDGQWFGYNTDADGFKDSLISWLEILPKAALVLGTGGASKAVQFALKELEVEFKVVSREASSEFISYEGITQELVEKTNLIVNTTPLGMFPNTDKKPDFPVKWLNNKHAVYDLIYNPEQTLFLNLANLQGCKTKNGLEMLHMQAEKSWEIWQKDSVL